MFEHQNTNILHRPAYLTRDSKTHDHLYSVENEGTGPPLYIDIHLRQPKAGTRPYRDRYAKYHMDTTATSAGKI